MSEELFYYEIGEFLRKKGFEYNKKIRVNFSESEIEKYGQKSWHFDVFGYGDHGTWAIECKKSCTLEQFGLALGQLIAYKHLLEDYALREKFENKINRKLCEPFYFSLALGESEQWTLRRQKNTFKTILYRYNLPFGVLLITKEQKVKEIIPAK